MRRCHDMPFGAALDPDGATNFRLWAPGAERVTLELEDGGTRAALPMRALDDGWYETRVERARAGTRYAFRPNDGPALPDPASRSNPDDVHGWSEVVDPRAFVWEDGAWRGRPWHEAVLYELHVGTFTGQGTFAAAIDRLDHLVALGVTALQLMPIAEFAGGRNWGYDAVLPYAPESTYGTPAELKAFVQAAHARGLMVLLDAVYNHFGPEGNYLGHFAPQVFDPERPTPWGAGIRFSGPHARPVRDFFRHNALFWLEEYHVDGLRLDAVHAIDDPSDLHLVAEIATAIRAGPGRDRHVHLVLENDRNEARYLVRDAEGRPQLATAQWNDDLHHAFHVLLTHERDGYYHDYADRPLWHLGRCLAEGFAWQGDASPYRSGTPRGEPSAHLPPAAFIAFLQTHDQVGNRAFGERLGALADPRALAAATACVLLAPAPPMLFMGEEFLAGSPFLYFCDFGPDLAAAVTVGRRAEFARFAQFSAPSAREAIPDPNDPASFERSKLAWRELDASPHREWLEFCRGLLRVRREHIVPRLAHRAQGAPGGEFESAPGAALSVRWSLAAGARLTLLANLAAAPVPAQRPPGRVLYSSHSSTGSEPLPPWSVHWSLQDPDG